MIRAIYCVGVMAFCWVMIKLIRHFPALIITALIVWALHIIFIDY